MTTADWIQNTDPSGEQAIHINRTIRSVAIGEGAVASGLNSFAQGLNAQATSDNAHAEGNGTLASGLQSHAEGLTTSAINPSAHAEGQQTTASGLASHAEGDGTIAAGDFSHAEGQASTALGFVSHVSGILANTFLVGQWTHASGQGGLAAPAVGNAQTSLVTMTGEVSGAGASVVLTLGSVLGGQLVLEDGKDYTFTVTAAVGAVQPGPARVGRGFILYFNVRRDGGVSVITASGVGQSFGDLSTNDWTFVAMPSAAGIDLTFTTGAIPSAAKVTAEVRFVEIAY